MLFIPIFFYIRLSLALLEVTMRERPSGGDFRVGF